MAVEDTTTKVTYVVTEGQTTYPITFPVNTDAIGNAVEIGVKVQDLDGIVLPELVEDDDFEIAGLTVTTVSEGVPTALTTGYRVTLFRKTPLTQDHDFRDLETFSAEVYETALDRLTFMVQRLSEEIGRCIKYPITDEDARVEIPTTDLRALTGLMFDSDGDLTVGNPATAVASAFMQTVMDDPTAAQALTTLGISAFMQTLLDDADGAAARATLGMTHTTEDLAETHPNSWVITGGKLTSPDWGGNNNEEFGKSVGISGSYVIAGVHGDDGEGADAGAAYIFRRAGSGLTFDAGTRLTASDAAAGDYFGAAVAISGDYAIVGAPLEAAGGVAAGAAYIFHRTGTNTWDAGVKIVAADAAAGAVFGMAVAISGDYAIVGAPDMGVGGAAYIFNRTDTNTWDAGVKIVAADAEADDDFGGAVAISGDYAIVGAKEEDAGGADAGAAYIFNRTGLNTWDAGAKIVADDAAAGDEFGNAVGISGDYAIVGASAENTGVGAVYVFKRTGLNAWDDGTKIASPTDDDDHFGYSVSISGRYALVGAEGDDAWDSNSGALYPLYRVGLTEWEIGSRITAPDGDTGDKIGSSVAIDGDYGVAGAPSEDELGTNAGAAYAVRRAFAT